MLDYAQHFFFFKLFLQIYESVRIIARVESGNPVLWAAYEPLGKVRSFLTLIVEVRAVRPFALLCRALLHPKNLWMK
jgi:hypothetical protein